MATDDNLGIDVSTPDGDVDTRLSLVSGRQLLAQDLLDRLMSDPGSLYYDASYGAGLGLFINESMSATELRRFEAIAADHCRRDDRVESARCTALFNESTETLTARFIIDDGRGSFEFTAGITEVSAQLILGTL